MVEGDAGCKPAYLSIHGKQSARGHYGMLIGVLVVK
jgi:hypothetical protein